VSYVRNTGLGFAAPTPTAVDSSGVNIFDSSTYMAVFQPGGLLDTSSWDWHQYALAGLAAYFVLSKVIGGTRDATSAVTGKVRKVGRRVKKGATTRRRALKTLFTG
jgi:hypothetical protein